MSDIKSPMQPLVFDGDVVRFKANIEMKKALDIKRSDEVQSFSRLHGSRLNLQMQAAQSQYLWVRASECISRVWYGEIILG